MNQQNFYDQLASDDYGTSQVQFQNEMKQIKTGLDKDLMAGVNLQDSSGLVNPLGLKEASLYNQKGGMVGQAPPNFGKREPVNLGDEEYNLPEPSARNPRESADLTIDMLQGQENHARRRQGSDDAPNLGASNMPRNHRTLQHPTNGPSNQNMGPPTIQPSSQIELDDGFSVEQFRQNNAQLQQIMMQLQAPASQPNFGQDPYAQQQQVSSNQFNQHQQRSNEQFKQQLSSAQTKHSGSNPSTKVQSYGGQTTEVSQFSYANHMDHQPGELPSSSQPMMNQYNSNGNNHNTNIYAPPAESQVQNMPPNNHQQYMQHQQPQRSTSPMDNTNNQLKASENPNYRQAFKPHSVIQNAAQNIMGDSKENYNMQSNLGGMRGPSPSGLAQNRQQQVSQVELLSQLQQSSSQATNLQRSSINTNNPPTNNYGGGIQGRNQNSQMYNQGQQQQLSQQASQPSLAGEFTLQPRQPGTKNEAQGPTPQMSVNAPGEHQVQARHNQIMMQFDDIPISRIQKLPGYQTGIGMQEGGAQQDTFEQSQIQNQAQPQGSLEDEEAQSCPIEERAQHSKWSIRLAAYKEINNAFYNDYAQFVESKGDQSTEYGPRGNPELMHSFDQYGPILEKMIQDSNLAAALEGLQVMHTFVKLALDIKNVTFASHNYLLEKAPTHKANFKEICTKILLAMLERGEGSYLYPELIKRMKSNQPKIVCFTSHVINEAFKAEVSLDDINLKNVFRMIQDNLSQKNKELRDLAMHILQHIYVRCGDDMATFVKNCKNLRPVQVKEITEVLGKLQKSARANHQQKLFEGNHHDEQADTSATSKDTKENEAAHRNGFAAASAFEVPQKDTNNQSDKVHQVEQIDLLSLIPENFAEIPYLTQINVKKRSMESFNAELVKLKEQSRGPGTVPIKNRDYTLIINTVIHMLEDKNMLVFLEGIKTVELLANLIGPLNYLKQAKTKIWVGLLASKYGETKTAVIAAVDKALQAIVRNAYNQVQFCQECINVIVSTHKNPRVKQFVIEHTIIPHIESISSEKDLCGNIFRLIKDKLVNLILKDTSASCRDASVSLLVTFKQIIPDNALIEAAITALPKYRVSEILKRVNPDQALENEAPTQDLKKGSETVIAKRSSKAESAMGEAENAQQKLEGGGKDGPQFAKSLTEKIKSTKQQAVNNNNSDPNQNSLQSAQNSFVEEILQGKFLTHETKVPLSEILYDLGTMRCNKFSDLYDSATMEQKWDTSLRQMGELGLRECKAVIIKAVFTVITTPKVQLFENQQSLKSLLSLVKRLFVLERSIGRDDDGKSSELMNYLRIALLQNVWIGNNQGETCQMLQVAMVATNNVFEFTEHLRDVVEQPMILQCPAALQIIEAVYVWLGIRLNDFLAAGMEINDLEMLRGFGIKFLDGAGFNEPQRQALISIMIKFKDLVQFKRNELDQVQVPTKESQQQDNSHHGESIEKELPSVSQLSRQHTPQITSEQDEEGGRLQSSQITHPQTAAFAHESLMQDSVGVSQKGMTPRGEVANDNELSVDNICRLIDTEFEKGLLLFKEMAQQQTLDFEIKERIFLKLLSIVSEGYKSNPQQQYKQAYALKALMWMKEETLGIEDCFRLTQQVMNVYAKSEVDELDSTVELYLLNFWTKDLSIRDLSDRIGLCVLNANGDLNETAYQTGYSVSMTAQNCSTTQLSIFNSILKWFSDRRLFVDEASEEQQQNEKDDEWLVSDLRKIVIYVTISALDKKIPTSEIGRSFLKNCVGKFGIEKVKEFMEIQLMHNNELSLKLLDWLEIEFESRIKQPAAVQAHKSLVQSSINVRPLNENEGEGDTPDTDIEESRIKLPAMPLVNLDDMIQGKHNSRGAADTQSVHSIGGDSNSAKNGVNQSNKMTPRGLAGASQSYKERRDLYKMKSSGKARESVATLADESISNSQPVSNYGDIINRIEQNLAEPKGSTIAVSASKQIAEASGESDEKEPEFSRRHADDDDDSNDLEESKDFVDAEQPFRRTNTSAYYKSIEKKRKRYTPSAEELADDHDIKGDSSDEDEEATVTKSKDRRRDNNVVEAVTPSVQDEQVHQIESQIQLSNIKGRHINDKIQMLELEKERIEHQTELLQKQKDEDNDEWRNKVALMQNEHTKVITNLDSVNQQYSAQVSENQNLKTQLEHMQVQHCEMMDRFEQIEKKMAEDRQRALSPAVVRQPASAIRESTAKKDIVVSVQKIQRIEDTFGSSKALTDGTQEEIQLMISRIQKLLLGVEKNVEGELAKPLIIHYTKLRIQDQRMQMLQALDQALDQNEDVMTALSAPVYQALLNYLLWAFAHEKQILENTSISAPNEQADQNEVTMLSQQLVSKLLNSKRFTTSLVCLFQLLRDAMPNDIAAELSIEERQYLRVIMRCIQRITRALHSEQHDLVRAFDVLLEMQKMFQKHPPELLREDLPCLADFDFIYRGMKDVSDKLIELQPEKVESFLSYSQGAEGEQQNAFIKYLVQMLGSTATTE